MTGKRGGTQRAKALKQQFAQALNEAVLRAEKRHGRVDRSRIATSLCISKGSVYAYLNGTTLPNTELLDRLMIELKLDPADAKHLATLRDSADLRQRGEAARGRDPATAVLSTDLPRDTTLLYGRTSELTRIRTALTRNRDGVVLCVVSGLAGVGKTALAVRTARTLDSEFPDGCLFVNLRGYAAEPAMPPQEAADKLLRQLAVPSESIPAQPDRRIALLRDELRHTRLLLILDNALDSAHVEPLLPNDGRCAVLITSRSNLNALDDARRVRIPPLSTRDSSELLAQLITDLPPDRSPEPAVRERVAAHCHGLPVAVRIAAAVLRSEPWPVPTDDQLVNLGIFHDGDRGVESLFEHSIARLEPELAHTFTLLGLHRGPAFDADAAAALAGLDLGTARRHLRRLIEANLLDAPLPGRYAFHDLLRVFAEHRARAEITPVLRHEALTRIVDHYLARSDAADRVLTPHRYRTGMSPVEHPYHYADYDAAVCGLHTDRDNLAAAARDAFDSGLDEQCWQIAFALRGFAFIADDLELWVETHELALAAARRAQNPHAEAVTRNNLGLALITRGDTAGAARMYARARALFAETGDAHGEHTTMAHQAWIHFHRGEYAEALRDSTEALRFVTRFGTPRNTAILLRDTALIELSLGRCLDAVPKLLEALEIFENFGLHVDEAMAYNVLGAAYHRLDDLPRARETFSRAIELGHTGGSLLEQARGHDGLAEIAAAQQDWVTAQHHWQQARTGFQQLHDTARVEAITARLGNVPR